MPTGTYISNTVLISTADAGFNLSNNVLSYSFDYSLQGYYVPAPVKSSSISRTTVSANPTTAVGSYLGSYADIFYNHIWLLPSTVDLTGAPSSYSTGILVWNSYFTSKTLSSVTPTNLTGISIAGTVPYTIPPLGTRSFTLTLSGSAPPTINGSYLFTFSDAEDPVLSVGGTLALVFPFSHDWNDNWSETYFLKTAVLESHNGREQRYKLTANPRRTFSTNVLLAEGDSIERNAQIRAFYHNIMAYGRSKVWLVPVWSDIIPVTTDIAAGISTLNVNTANLDIKNNGYLVLYKNYDNYEVVSVQSFTSSSVTLTAPTANNWERGSAILPALRATITDEMLQGSVITYDVEKYGITWSVTTSENEVINKIANYTPVETYNGYPVFFDEHNFAEDPSVEIYSPNRLIDFEIGSFLIDPRYNFDKVRTSYTYLLRDRAAISQFLGFFKYVNGKQKAFWVPTYARDIQITNSGLSSATSIDIKNIGYASFIRSDTRKRDIMLVKPDNSYILRRIVSAVDNGNGTETLNLDQPIGMTWNSTTFKAGHFLRLVRLDQDSLEVSYMTNTFGSASLVLVDIFEG